MVTPDLKTGDYATYKGREIVISGVSGTSIDGQFTDNDEPVVIPPAEYQEIKKAGIKAYNDKNIDDYIKDCKTCEVYQKIITFLEEI